MIYYHIRLNIIAEFSYDFINDIPLMKISEDNEFIAFTYEWEAVGVL